MKRFLVVGVVASALLLNGCSAASGGNTSGSVADSGMVVAPGMPEGGQSDTTKLNSDGSVASDGSVSTDTSRSVVKTASVEVAVDSPLDVAPNLTAIATDAGGFVQDSSASPANEYQGETAYATLRVPADKLDAVTEKVLALGTYVSSSQSETDVTLQVTDVDARIASLTTSIDRLTALMANATSTADLLAAETALAQRQAELDSLVAQRDYLANQVDLATLSVSLIQTFDAAPTSQSFWDGLTQGWTSVVNAGSVLVVALGFLVPWLAILIVVGLIAWLIIWYAVRASHRRTHASASQTDTEPTP